MPFFGGVFAKVHLVAWMFQKKGCRKVCIWTVCSLLCFVSLREEISKRQSRNRTQEVEENSRTPAEQIWRVLEGIVANKKTVSWCKQDGLHCWITHERVQLVQCETHSFGSTFVFVHSFDPFQGFRKSTIVSLQSLWAWRDVAQLKAQIGAQEWNLTLLHTLLKQMDKHKLVSQQEGASSSFVLAYRTDVGKMLQPNCFFTLLG